MLRNEQILYLILKI